MERNTYIEIKRYDDRYGSRLLNLMDKCDVVRLPDVPEDKAVEFLNDLKRTGA